MIRRSFFSVIISISNEGWRSVGENGNFPCVPRKIRQLVADLQEAGFTLKSGGKGSHRKFRHVKYSGSVILSGADGADAKHYQEREVRNAIEAVNK